MKQHFTDEQTGIHYTLQGDYYLPDLALPEVEESEIGLWGQRHLCYIRQHKKALYISLLTNGGLNDYLAQLNKQAEEMYFRLVAQMSTHEGVTEQLIAEDQMEWVGQMNNIRNRAMEMVNADLIYS